MTWLTWRQYRASAAIGAALLAALAVLLVITGLQMAAQFHTAVGPCLAANDCRWPADNLSLGSGLTGFLVEFTLAGLLFQRFTIGDSSCAVCPRWPISEHPGRW